MRAMLPILRDQVIVHQEKAIIWTRIPAEQGYVATTLKEANMDAEVFHSGLSPTERASLVQRFTRDPKSCMVLVCTYSVSSAGLNLQNLCRNVHIFSCPPNRSAVEQAIGRNARIGQDRVVLVYEYQLLNSFDMELVQRNKQKFIPGFIAEMSREAYEGRGDVNEVVDIGRWVLRDGELYQLIDNEIATSTDNADKDAILHAFLAAFS